MYRHDIALRWRDTDAFRHVNHAVFLTYLEIGRDAFMTSLFGTPEIYVIARVELDYRGEILLEHGTVTTEVTLERIGGSSVITRERILLPDGSVAAEARVVLVMWDHEAHASRALTDHERAAFAPHLTAD